MNLPHIGRTKLNRHDVIDFFRNAPLGQCAEIMDFLRRQKPVTVRYNQSALKVFGRHLVGKDQHIQLDTALLFILAGAEEPAGLAKAVVVSDSTAIEMAHESITHMKPFVLGQTLADTIAEIAGYAAALEPADIPITVNQANPPKWLELLPS